MSGLVSRGAILQFFGATAACTLLEPLARDTRLGAAPEALVDGGQHLSFTPVRLPHPLPIYQQHPSYLATGLSTGTVLPASSNTQLASYTVIDDLVVPPEYERYVLVHWGDRMLQTPGDIVTTVDEKVGLCLAHGLVNFHPPELWIDPPALTGSVPTP